MDTYIAIRGKCRGRIYELTDDGLEELSFRKNEQGHLVPAGYQGLVMSFKDMQQDLIRLVRHGSTVDKKFYDYTNK